MGCVGFIGMTEEEEKVGGRSTSSYSEEIN